jgi:hypothetical protein
VAMAVKWSFAENDQGPGQVGPPEFAPHAPVEVARMLMWLRMMEGSAPLTSCRQCRVMSQPRRMCKDCPAGEENAFCSLGCLMSHAAEGHPGDPAAPRLRKDLKGSFRSPAGESSRAKPV